MEYVLGIDLGTSSLKGVLINKEGREIATASYAYSFITLKDGYSEQNPHIWVEAINNVILKIVRMIPDVKENLKGISFSGQMHSLVLLDKNDEILRDAILWNDGRTSKQCIDIIAVAGHRMLDITKNRALQGFTLPKLLWVRENEKELFDKIDTFLLPKDYLGLYLTGNKQTDYSDAAGTLLLDIKNMEWSVELIEQFGLPKHIFPKLCASYDSIGTLKVELKKKYGFNHEVRIFTGGADNACAAIASGITTDDVALCSIGTSGVFLCLEDDANNDYKGNLHYFNHVNDKYYAMGVTLSAGSSLQWFVKNFCDDTFDKALKNVSKIPIGCDGLLFTPYLMGERTPYFDSNIRGSFTRMCMNHTKDHFARSVLEGITFSLKDAQEVMYKATNKRFAKIVSVGGGAKNKDWLQMQADIFDASIVTLQNEQGPALGAAMIAAVALEWYSDFISCGNVFVAYKKQIVHPLKDNAERYKQVYKTYKKVYKNTKTLKGKRF